ncbi:MCE family protein [Wenzhouxiangella sp. AB-CW3]|uniref:MlaD family protein n=1 Tax=Wenzhouxiangella sp. AB-CW3 TaxID=2771012 RepID=UPI00168B6EDF|nr:MlaD family protein [Wenzhouxiangella sp. AB-CW3]QOC22114.1 MCE family protein [Wenzhouxiangella sp. AB-CW3]
METRANHVLIGAFTIAGLIMMLAIGLWAARYAADDAWKEYEVVFEHPVSGLSSGSTVQYNGINMGSVRELSLSPDDPSRVIARIRLEAGAPVREDTVARLTVSGLTGVAFIQLRGGSPESPALEPGPDGKPPQILAEESGLQKLIDASEDIASMASEVMLRLLEFLSEDNAERVTHTLDNIDRLSQTILAEGDMIAETIGNLHAGSAELAGVMTRSQQLMEQMSQALAEVDEHLLSDLPGLSEDLSTTMDRLARASERIDRVLADNEAAFSEFGVEVLAPLGPTVQEFRQLVRELSRLSSRFQRHPTRFLLGGDQPEEYQPQ